MTTRAPSSSRASTIPRPMPAAPPVTTATLPLRSSTLATPCHGPRRARATIPSAHVSCYTVLEAADEPTAASNQVVGVVRMPGQTFWVYVSSVFSAASNFGFSDAVVTLDSYCVMLVELEMMFLSVESNLRATPAADCTLPGALPKADTSDLSAPASEANAPSRACCAVFQFPDAMALPMAALTLLDAALTSALYTVHSWLA